MIAHLAPLVSLRLINAARCGLLGQTGPIGKNTTLSSSSLVVLDGVWAERSEAAPPALSSLPVIGAGKGDVLLA